ncbi:O(6)-methylguanine-induced apoptosis 2 [Gadus macrocephalus]|uniref:O(6)-methylguanine-induced apoptosis 2 n=1 Tax=Gadus macrocephalus TaxID=80720 RepID=UPI0028CB878E|nr:O(6)-methylguanine-induced apoptosis 2 [Gadus macrocephalus]XP_059899194.1 O(6)-methylguanine-induced apoptosis 2 [Gadus macrocephalus]
MGKLCTGKSDVRSITGYTCSIPSKYQTVVVDNEEKMGFSSQSKRFSLDTLNENPGPGSYCPLPSAETFSPSFSKKGTASFPSKVPRVPRHHKRGLPGPDSYNLQSSSIARHSFGRGASRAFRAPVAVPMLEPKFRTPGPDQYDVSGGHPGGSFQSKGSSTFLSSTKRCDLAINPNLPSPCHYQISCTATKNSPRAAMSPFKSKSSRFPAQVDHRVPGPGAYNLHHSPDPLRKPTLLRRKVLVMATPARLVPKGPAYPGPGQYDLVDYEGPATHPGSTAAFLSETRRSPQGGRAPQAGPGPGYYEPQKLSKKSFLYNPKIWNPV